MANMLIPHAIPVYCVQRTAVMPLSQRCVIVTLKPLVNAVPLPSGKRENIFGNASPPPTTPLVVNLGRKRATHNHADTGFATETSPPKPLTKTIQ